MDLAFILQRTTDVTVFAQFYLAPIDAHLSAAEKYNSCFTANLCSVPIVPISIHELMLMCALIHSALPPSNIPSSDQCPLYSLQQHVSRETGIDRDRKKPSYRITETDTDIQTERNAERGTALSADVLRTMDLAMVNKTPLHLRF